MIFRIRKYIPLLILIAGCSAGYVYDEKISPEENTLLAADKIENLFSLIVTKEGELLIENYFNGNSGNFVNNTQSVTKSILSLIVGIALNEGHIKSLNDGLLEYIYFDNEEFDALNLEHLLTMTSGISWDENRDFIPWLSAPSQINYVFGKSLANMPGERFNYNSGAVHLLSPVTEKAVGVSLQEYAINKLFLPLDIRNINWQRDNEGYYQGSTGLSLRPLDLAKIGGLIISRGERNGVRILDPLWLEYCLAQRSFIRDDWNELNDIGYGALWWTAELRGYKVIFAWGYGGQFLFLLPELNSVVVTTGRWRVDSGTAVGTEEEIIELLRDFIIPMLDGYYE